MVRKAIEDTFLSGILPRFFRIESGASDALSEPGAATSFWQPFFEASLAPAASQAIPPNNVIDVDTSDTAAADTLTHTAFWNKDGDGGVWTAEWKLLSDMLGFSGKSSCFEICKFRFNESVVPAACWKAETDNLEKLPRKSTCTLVSTFLFSNSELLTLVMLRS